MDPKDINRLADLIVGEMGKKDAMAGDRGCFSSNQDFICTTGFQCTGGTYSCANNGIFDCAEFFECLTFFVCGDFAPFNCGGQFICDPPQQYQCGAEYDPR